MEAFQSTLEVVKESDLLVHIVDSSAPDPGEQIEAVRSVLGEIGADHVPELLAFNKTDVAPDAKRLVDRHPGSVMLSALTGEGLDALLATVADRLRALAPVVELVVPYDRGDVVAALHREGEVLSETHEAHATRMRARWCGFRSVMSRSSRYTRPAVGACRPVMTLNSVVLPAPLGPMSPVTRPAAASRSIPARALTPPKRTSTASTRNSDRVLHLLGLGGARCRGGDRVLWLDVPRVQPADASAERRELARPPVGVAHHAEGAEAGGDVDDVADALERLLHLRQQAEREPAHQRAGQAVDADDHDEEQQKRGSHETTSAGDLSGNLLTIP